MKRYAIIDPDTHAALTIVAHDEAHDAEMVAEIEAAEAHNATVESLRAAILAGDITDFPIDVEDTIIEISPFVAWQPPEGSVEVDETIQVGDVYDPDEQTWSRPPPPPAPATAGIDADRLITGLYQAGVLTDTSLARVLGDPEGSTYAVGDDGVLTRVDG